MGTPHAAGKDATIVFFIDGNPTQEIDCKSWEMQRNATEINDGVCGEDRDRLDSITNFFVIDVECFTKTAKVLDALLADQAVDDSGAAATEKNFSLVLKPRDGSKKGYSAREVSLGAWRIGAGGRTDRIMTKVPLRARYFDPVSL